MFRESLMETSHATVFQRGWATLMSFGVEMAVISTLVLMPMFCTQVVPAFRNMVSPPSMTSVTTDQIRRAINIMTGSGPVAPGSDGAIHAPGSIPAVIDLGAPRGRNGGGGSTTGDPCAECVFSNGPFNSGGDGRFWTGFFNTGTPPPVLQKVEQDKPKVIRQSHMDPGMLITSIEPKYPEIARIARVQGEVVLAALIDRNGRIVNLRTLSGHPMLVPPALDAVRQWRYRPTFLNGQPVEVETQIVVNFRFK